MVSEMIFIVNKSLCQGFIISFLFLETQLFSRSTLITLFFTINHDGHPKPSLDLHLECLLTLAYHELAKTSFKGKDFDNQLQANCL